MTKTNGTFLSIPPLLLLLAGGLTLTHDHLSWLFGGAIWLAVSRLYIVPRKMKYMTAKTAPDFLGLMYGATVRRLMGIIYSAYFFGLLVKGVQQWNRLGYMASQPQVLLWMIGGALAAVCLCTWLHNTYFYKTIMVICLIVLSGLMPLLIHHITPMFKAAKFFGKGFPQVSAIYATYFTKLNPSACVLGILVGHPLLASVLPGDIEKKEMMRTFKLAAIVLCCLSIVSSMLAHQLRTHGELTENWKNIVLVYHGAKYVLTLSFLCYVTTTFLSHDVLHGAGEDRVIQQRFLIASAVSIAAILSAHFVPSRTTLQALTLIRPVMMSAHILFLLALIGMQPSKNGLYSSLLIPVLIYVAVRVTGVPRLLPYELSITVWIAFIAFLTLHYIDYGSFSFMKRNWWEKQEIKRLALKLPEVKRFALSLLSLPLSIILYAKQGVYRERIPYKSVSTYFALICLLGVHLWAIDVESAYSTAAYIMLAVALVLCAGLLIQPLWPRFLGAYFALYWYICLTYYLVTMPVAFFFFSNKSPIALVNLVMSLMILARRTNIISFLAVNFHGLVDTLLVLSYFAPETLQATPLQLYQFTYSYLGAFFVSLLFINRTGEELEETRRKLQVLIKKSISTVSNALNITKSYASIIQLCTESMVVTKEEDNEDNIQKVLIRTEQDAYATLQDNLTNLLGTIDISRGKLKHIFLPINAAIDKQDFSFYQASPCVKEALEIFTNDYEIQKPPKLYIEEDFRFYGSDQTLIAVLIQLLQNAHEHSDAQGEIAVVIKEHKILIKNHGSAISKTELPHIFNEFYTTSSNNLGLGLFFAMKVMDAFKGKIYLMPPNEERVTCFVLSFPKITDKQ